MTRKTLQAFWLPLTALLALSGCGLFSDDLKPAQKPPDFRVAEGESRIFIYAFYENPGDKPSDDESFRIDVDGGFRGDIDETQYVQDRLSPGAATIDVDEITWTGNIVNHATLKTKLKPDQANFYTVHVYMDAKTEKLKIDILNPPPAEGMRQVEGRTYLCACGK